MESQSEVSEDRSYQFTNDWFDRHIPNWRRFLGHLRGEPVRYLEVGVYEGRSLVWMLSSIMFNPECSYSTIDPFEDEEVKKRFSQNLNSARDIHEHIQAMPSNVIEDYSFEALTEFSVAGETFNVIYIDGSHDPKDVLVDLVISWRLLTSGGIMIMDDYQWLGNSDPKKCPKFAIDMFLEMHADEMTVMHKGIQVFVRKK